MKEIKLEKLIIRNFKGISLGEFEFSEITSILGKNGSGKTTVYDAFCWLIDGKNSQETQKFAIKNVNKNTGKKEDNDIISVEGYFSVDGKMRIIKREQSEIWAPEKRGSSLEVMKGNTTSYYIDDIPIDKESEFKNRVLDIFPPASIFKLLSNPLYFCQTVDWKERRAIIESIIGEVTDEFILEKSPSLAILIEELQSFTISDIRKRTNSNRLKISEQKKTIPSRIDEVKMSIPEVKKDFKLVEKERENLVKERNELNDILINLSKSNDEINKEILLKKEELFSLKSKEKESYQKCVDDFDRQGSELNKELNKINDYLSELLGRYSNGKNKWEATCSSFQNTISEITNNIETQKKILIDLGDEFIEVSVREEPNFSGGECPTCGVWHNSESMTKDRKKVIEDFNKQKSDELNSINNTGKRTRDLLEKNESRFLEEEKNHIQKYDSFLKWENNIKEEIKNIESKKLFIENKIKDNTILPLDHFISLSKDLLDIKASMSLLENSIEQMEADKKDIPEDLETKEKINSLDSKIKDLEKILVLEENIKISSKRLKELQELDKKLSVELSKLDGIIYDCEEYERIKYTEIENRANTIFDYVSVKMFNKQINGGYESVCDITHEGVPFPSVNTAGKILCGIDVINTLSNHFGFSIPIFIDNRESVTDIPSSDSQIINLVVSEDEELLIKHG